MIFEKYSTMYIKDNQHINEIYDDDHSNNNDHYIEKNQVSKLMNRSLITAYVKRF